MLDETFIELLMRDESTGVVCIGANSEVFVQDFKRLHPEFTGRIHFTGAITAGEVSLCLRACDLCVQLYPDGATSRRTSLMAVLSHGIPVITSVGPLSDSIWQEPGFPILPLTDPLLAAVTAQSLLQNRVALATSARLSREFYEKHFALDLSLDSLTSETIP